MSVLEDEYQCKVCGYVYLPDAGDVESMIPPHTAWDAVASDWTCPICNAGKAFFVRNHTVTEWCIGQ
ncbi:MAG: rubredoxin [Treponema sp.]|nr:rubredoxin [Treponema sp.]